MGNGILIIDDDEDDCTELEEALYHIGVSERIEHRLSAKAGLEFLKEHRADLPTVVVVDMNMPEMNGILVLQKIMTTYSVKTIMYTTSCNEEMVKEVKALGAVDCIQKGTSYTDNLKFAKRVADLLG